ncbi:hypothetical protein D3C80_2122580 [compost metagenome]
MPGSGGVSFTVSSDVLARGVYLTAEQEGIFSDNFFDLLPGEEKTVQFLQSGGLTAGVEAGTPDFTPAVPQGLEVRSMADYVK